MYFFTFFLIGGKLPYNVVSLSLKKKYSQTIPTEIKLLCRKQQATDNHRGLQKGKIPLDKQWQTIFSKQFSTMNTLIEKKIISLIFTPRIPKETTMFCSSI